MVINERSETTAVCFVRPALLTHNQPSLDLSGVNLVGLGEGWYDHIKIIQNEDLIKF